MLTQLKELSQKAKIKMFIESTDDEMQVIIFFEVEDSKKNKLNIAPLVVSGTAEELDKELVRTIEIFTKKNISSLERIDFVTKSISKAEKTVTKDAISSNKKSKIEKAKKPEQKDGLFANTESQEKKEVIPSSTATAKEEVNIEAIAEVVKEPEQITTQISGIAKPTTMHQANFEDAIAEMERQEKAEHEESLEKEASGISEEDAEERTLEQIERIAKLKNLGFIEKPEEKQFVCGGIGIGTVMILGCSAADFQKTYLQLEENIKKSKENNKPKKSFSEFQAEKIEFPEPIIFGTESAQEVDKIKEQLQEVGLAPTPKPIPTPTPVVQKTMEQLFIELVAEFKEAGYDIGTMKSEDYKSKDSIDQMREWLKQNPLK